MAYEFGVLPTVARRDLYNDPDRFSLACLDLLRYGRAFAVHALNDAKESKAYGDQKTLTQVETIARELAEEEVEAEEAEAAAGDEGVG